MKYFNINDPSEKVSLREAVLKSINTVSGLYMPDYFPSMPSRFFDSLSKMNLRETAFEVSHALFGSDLPVNVLERIVNEAFIFNTPLRQLDKNLWVLELFHGPTLAFKDVGARYMAGLMEYFVRDEDKETTILVATSGDTGSAVASAFFNRKGINVIILYPSGKVSELQEKQLTTMGGKITTLEIGGDFDDCQRLVKLAFSDSELTASFNLTSGNSINFGRLFPQSFYYFHAWGQVPLKEKPIVFSVPSGNFGNLTAGLIAKKMGLPVSRFIAATNSNHSIVDYLETGRFEPSFTRQTITNAMDVGNPSNFPRILSLFGNSHEELCSVLKGCWFTDEETRNAMRELQGKYSYQSDPHGAVGYLGLKKYMEKESCSGIFLETAHPAKFIDEVEKTTGTKVDIPDKLGILRSLEKKSVKLSPDFNALKEFLVEKLQRVGHN
jgi:threonine synthase